ncbi:acetyl-CoA carboxylase biotin carboxyl carrier protein [Psychrilyobacter atlanticus]|uniref:acetyl-CoA carboxylase biotin carboxyl carrier protein n=1 Tax=Psychrilyobacter atlanticus TaxID=271091 RepID=UPI0003FA2B81|nr:biotin/lipoyl-containing protein [Psychrilyobacter atlanticus]
MKNDMNTINEIIKVIGESQLTEISIEEKDFKLLIKKPKLVLEGSIEEVEEIEEAAAEVAVTEQVKEIISESVGRFYYINKDEKPMMTVGMAVKKGQKVGYVEAIGIKTDIKSEFDGEIKEILVKNGEVAEYGKVLVKIGE